MTELKAFNVPMNSLSFGQVSAALLREAFGRGVQARIFPVAGQADLSAQPKDEAFEKWLREGCERALRDHSRDDVSLKLWHVNGSWEAVSREQILLTFHETDSITPVERRILANQKAVLVTSRFTKRVMEDFGLKNVRYVELGFDKGNFRPTGKPYLGPDVAVFGMFGKMESRKATLKVVRAWARKFGNDRRYRLHCAVQNPFMKLEDQLAALNQALEGKRYWNIEFIPWMKTNEEFNDACCACDVVLAMSGGEGRDLPCFHCVGLGKHAVALDAHCYKDYLDDSSAVLVPPSGKRPSADGMFFHAGQPFNQGSFFDFSDDDFLSACEKALERLQADRTNRAGLELQERTLAATFDQIAEAIQ